MIMRAKASVSCVFRLVVGPMINQSSPKKTPRKTKASASALALEEALEAAGQPSVSPLSSRLTRDDLRYLTKNDARNLSASWRLE